MARNIQGARLLVTGASSGIGRAIALKAAGQGARVAVVSRSADKLDALVKEIKGDVLPVAGDITNADDRKRMIHTAAERFGGLDVLVNNAGVASFGHFATNTEAVLRQVMETNFFAPAELIRLAIPVLTQGCHPAIVNVSSMCGRRGMPAWSEYSASKFAMCGLTESLRGEMARFDIDVLLIVPGLTKSGLHDNMIHNTGRMKIEFDKGQPPERVADAVLRSLRYNITETVVGSEAAWILRFNRWLPRLTEWLITRRVKKLYQEPAAG
jgi:NAD(P)-dependent dehydrogenase (short-subunit alcohol dehydrogenase family)